MNFTNFDLDQLFSMSDDSNPLMMIVWILPIILFVFYGQQIQLFVTSREIKKALKKLESFREESRTELINYVKNNLKTKNDPVKKIDKFLDYFTIMPVDMDPNGIVEKVHHTVRSREDYTRAHVKSLYPEMNNIELNKIQTLLEIASSAIPKMLTFDFWTNITLPMISTFLHTRFSALNVNNPAKKTGYFFGSFFILKKTTYQEIGMHEGVKQEIIEDGALGKKVKDAGYKMKMVRGEHLIEAIWARDKGTLWNALKRLMVPLYLQSGKIAIGIFFAIVFLLFVPFPILAISTSLAVDATSAKILCITSAIASVLIYIGAIIEVKIGLKLKLVYAIFAPLGSLVVVLGFLSGLLQAKRTSSVTWRGRSYSMKDHSQSSISV